MNNITSATAAVTLDSAVAQSSEMELDKNNNHVSDAIQSDCGHSSNLSSENQPLPNVVAVSHTKCDGCTISGPELILRWCVDCKWAICDACVLDSHVLSNHTVIMYQEACRRENKEFEVLLNDSTFERNKIRNKRNLAYRKQRQTREKLGGVKSKVNLLATDSNKNAQVMTLQYVGWTKLGDVVLNARTFLYRRQVIKMSGILAAMASERQASIIGQLKRCRQIVAEMYEAIERGEKVEGVEVAGGCLQ